MEATPRLDVALSEFTTIGIGGPARYFLEVGGLEELISAVAWSETKGLPHFILGGGSNILFPDSGFDGLIIRINLKGSQARIENGSVMLQAMAGENWDDLVALAVSRNWSGVECLSGIPGKVGAAPIQNIGAYGQELAETLTRVFAFDLNARESVTLSSQACRFTYRNSIFKGEDKGRYIITGIELKLKLNGAPTIRYPELAARVSPEDGLARTRNAVLAIRRGKSMVIDPADPNSKSCGSFFLNPILDPSEYRAFAARAPRDHPSYPVAPDSPANSPIKLSAAWLMDQSGFHKGYVRGNVGLSANHCLAIINRGGGTSAEVKELIEEVRKKVFTRFGVKLMAEPVLVS